MFSKFAVLARRYPLVPSMMTYSVLYPSANLLQQYAFRETTKVTGVDWKEVSRSVTVETYSVLLTRPEYFQIHDIRRSLPRSSGLQLAETGGQTVPQADNLPPPGQGVHGPDLLCSCRPLHVLRWAQRARGKRQRGNLQGVEREIPQHLGCKFRIQYCTELSTRARPGAGGDSTESDISCMQIIVRTSLMI